MRLLSLSLDVKKLILLFIGFVSLTTFSYSQPNKPIVSEGLFTKVAEYAELIVDGVNKKSTNFQGYFEYSTDKPPIQGEKCSKKAPVCEYPMSVPQFIKEMKMKGWTLVSSSTQNGGGIMRHFQYLFRKE